MSTNAISLVHVGGFGEYGEYAACCDCDNLTFFNLLRPATAATATA